MKIIFVLLTLISVGFCIQRCPVGCTKERDPVCAYNIERNCLMEFSNPCTFKSAVCRNPKSELIC